VTSAVIFIRKNRRNLPYPMFLPCTKAKDLKSAGVRDQWSFPIHESVEPTHPIYEILAKAEV